ncbi:MAG TPA: hypothetical protein VH418_21755 [Solirubrobacteraceae bacterium]|jgi:hypothetical protein
MAPLDADAHRRAVLDRREREVAAREAELARGRMWRALVWRVRLVPLRLVELIIGTWLAVAAVVGGAEVLRVSALLSGVLLVTAAVLQLAG